MSYPFILLPVCVPFPLLWQSSLLSSIQMWFSSHIQLAHSPRPGSPQSKYMQVDWIGHSLSPVGVNVSTRLLACASPCAIDWQPLHTGTSSSILQPWTGSAVLKWMHAWLIKISAILNVEETRFIYLSRTRANFKKLLSADDLIFLCSLWYTRVSPGKLSFSKTSNKKISS